MLPKMTMRVLFVRDANAHQANWALRLWRGIGRNLCRALHVILPACLVVFACFTSQFIGRGASLTIENMCTSYFCVPTGLPPIVTFVD